MFENKKYIKFLQKSKKQSNDILCINVLEKNDSSFKKSTRMMLINTNNESIGFEFETELKKFIFTYTSEIIKNKKGKFLAFTKSVNSKTIYCWVEPFYVENSYGYIGQALNYAIKNQKMTLLRSTKFSGAHSFVPYFNEDNNLYKNSSNIFYDEINSPTKVLILGASKGYIELIKNCEQLSWQTTLCDLKGNIQKKIKLLDEVILLNSIDNTNKVLDKNYEVVIILEDEKNSLLYFEKALESNIKNIVVLNSTNSSSEILARHIVRNKVLDEGRVKLVKNNGLETLNKFIFKACKSIDDGLKIKEEIVYESA